jgi:hypothetical protein
MTIANNARPNKTDAGKGSCGIYRAFGASRSPSPDSMLYAD